MQPSSAVKRVLATAFTVSLLLILHRVTERSEHIYSDNDGEWSTQRYVRQYDCHGVSQLLVWSPTSECQLYVAHDFVLVAASH